MIDIFEKQQNDESDDEDPKTNLEIWEEGFKSGYSKSNPYFISRIWIPFYLIDFLLH